MAYEIITQGENGLFTDKIYGDIFESTLFFPRLWWMWDKFKWPPLPVNTPGIMYPQDTDSDGYIVFEDVVQYDSLGTAYIILDIDFYIPEMLGSHHYYLASDKISNDLEVTKNAKATLSTQYNVDLTWKDVWDTKVTTYAVMYNDLGDYGNTNTDTVIITKPKMMPYNYLYAKPIIATDFTTICNTLVYVNATAYDSYNKLTYSAYSSIPIDRNLDVHWELVTYSAGTYLIVSPSNPFAVQVNLDANNQQDTVLRCYFNKDTPWESYSDTTIKRTPADTSIAMLSMTINKTRENNTYLYGSKAGYIPDVLVTQMQQQLTYFDNSLPIKPRYPSGTDTYIISWQNPQDSSIYTCTSRSIYLVESQTSFTKITDLALTDEYYITSTDKNLAIGCTFNFTDPLLQRKFKDRTQIQNFISSDVDKTAFVVTDLIKVPLSMTNTSIIQQNVTISRTGLVINAYSDTQQVTPLGISSESYNSGYTISRPQGAAYSTSESTPQVTPLAIVLNSTYQSTTVISRFKGISIGN